MKLTLKPGRYFAGVSIPFFVPNSLVKDAIEELGGRNVTITSRGDLDTLPVNPKIDPKYSDDWDELVTADLPRRAEDDRHAKVAAREGASKGRDASS